MGSPGQMTEQQIDYIRQMIQDLAPPTEPPHPSFAQLMLPGLQAVWEETGAATSATDQSLCGTYVNGQEEAYGDDMPGTTVDEIIARAERVLDDGE